MKMIIINPIQSESPRSREGWAPVMVIADSDFLLEGYQMEEIWLNVPGYKGYTISNYGRIKGPGKNRAGNTYMTPMKSKDGYLYIFTKRPGVPRKLLIHRAVLMAFVGICPTGKETMHLNSISEDNRLMNLKWGTRKEQRAQEIKEGKRIGENAKAAKLTEKDVLTIRSLRGEISARKLGVIYGVSHTTILGATNGHHWSHI